MNGPEHYREAERLLSESSTETVALNRSEGLSDLDIRAYESILSLAQVHATLALAAAEATDLPEWSEVTR